MFSVMSSINCFAILSLFKLYSRCERLRVHSKYPLTGVPDSLLPKSEGGMMIHVEWSSILTVASPLKNLLMLTWLPK